MKHNYKKNKLEQIRAFCAVVECGDISSAAKKINTSVSSISLQIMSLEQDLQISLFNRDKNRLIVNKNGKEYYKSGRELLDNFNIFYNYTLEKKSSKFQRFLVKIKIYSIKWCNSLLKKLNKMLIKITLKRALSFLLFILLGTCLYLYQTNYFFDKKLKKLSNSLLKEVIEKGYYRISANEKCQSYGGQMNRDVPEMLSKINNKDLSVTIISVNQCPSQIMRMNGDDLQDKTFNNQNVIKCNTETFYLGLKKMLTLTKNLLKNNKNAKFYSLYEKENCVNHSIFVDNLLKYPNQLFGIKLNPSFVNEAVGRTWIIKKHHYYYLITETNGLQGHIEDQSREHYLIFKKLTLKELMEYDHGSYWKLIKDYNIKIG